MNLYELHAAGGDVAGPHGDAWLKLSAVRNDRAGILDLVRDLHARLGRRVIPGDLTGQPLPVSAGGDLPPAFLAAGWTHAEAFVIDLFSDRPAAERQAMAYAQHYAQTRRVPVPLCHLRPTHVRCGPGHHTP